MAQFADDLTFFPATDYPMIVYEIVFVNSPKKSQKVTVLK